MSAHEHVVVPTTENCRFCWMCRHVCPVGHVTHRETLTPHAWALTIESVKRGQLAWNRETADVMYACADCGLCQANCVTDQPLPDAIVRTRSELASAGLAAPIVYELDQRLNAYGNVYAKTSPVGGSETADVGLFVGDAAHIGSASVDAALALLARAGITALPISRGRSSGLLANTLGLQQTASSLARAVLADIKAARVKELLVLTPGDRWTFTHVYGARLGVDWPADVAIRTVTSALAEALGSGKLHFKPNGPDLAHVYHDPCRSVGHHGDQPDRSARALLDAALGGDPARQLFWREGRAHPCGAVGGLEFTQPALADSLAESRFADASAAGAKCIVTEDPVCVYHLTARRPAGIDVHNLYELLAAHCA